jgi:hypothetical protein
MGGVKPFNDGEAKTAWLEPDEAANNMFDMEAATFFYRRCQELGVPLIIVSRWTAYAAKMPRATYDELALTGSSIGWRLRNAQRTSIEELWTRACAEEGDPTRKGLPLRCNRDWFLSTFCSKCNDASRGGDDTIWDLVDGFMQYDTVAVRLKRHAL